MDEERGIGERGPDKKKRDFNPKSLFNLKQFQKPVSNVTPSVNPAVNSGVNWSKIGIILLFVITAGLAMWKIRNRKKLDL
ncbi:MAG: hypothetical protein AB1608_07190 [Thermoproteota archaeon]